jgi:signal peptidase I
MPFSVNVDAPGFPLAVLTILTALRLATVAVERTIARRAAEEVGPPPAPPAAPPPADASIAPPSALALDASLEASDAVCAEPAAPSPTSLAAPPLTPAVQPPPRVIRVKPHDEPSAPAGFSWVNELLDSAIIAVALVFFLIRPFVLQAFYIPSESMVPSLLMGDKLLATKYTYHLRDPKPGDVVVFHPPAVALRMQNQPVDPEHRIDYVKRIIAVPGDRVQIRADQGVFVNDHLVSEPYINAKPDYYFPRMPSGEVAAEVTSNEDVRLQLVPHIQGDVLVIPPGYLFVLGDNRTMSFDSHRWGLLRRKDLVGKAQLIFWPPERFGFIR